jgi:HNH endonuclease
MTRIKTANTAPPDFSLLIKWSEVEQETITIKSSFVKGDFLNTKDYVLDSPNYFDYYEARIEEIILADTIGKLVLNYRIEDNSALLEKHGSQACGTSTITWNGESLDQVEVNWVSIEGVSVKALEAHIFTLKKQQKTAPRLIRDAQNRFKSELLQATSVCEISGETEPSVLEAAHIVPVSDKGDFEVWNGLLLRADIHTLFDRGLIKIDLSSGTVSLTDKVKVNSHYQAEVKHWRLNDQSLKRVNCSLKKLEKSRNQSTT